MVEVEVANRSGGAVDERAAGDLVREVLAAEGIDEGEVGLVFVPADEARRLKREHLGVDETPDVLAFPLDGREPLPDGVPRHIGDLVVCPDVVGAEWREPLIHGTLHLVGYDHGEEMEAREEVLRR
jgi:probable rRNA maturation factor